MGYVSDFSPDGKFFALLDSDGKLKIWDIRDSRLVQEYVPNLHLSEPYTCFVWVLATAGKDRKKKYNAETTLYIALGTTKGGVDLYSHATGKVESKLKGNGHAGAVTFICLHNDSTLYTSGEDCHIIKWSLTKGAMQDNFAIGTIVPTCIVSLPISNTLLVGCKELSQWSLDKRHELIATFTGHSADVQSMKMLKLTDRQEEYVVTTAKSNREIYLWHIDSNIKNPLRGTFLMEYAASFVSCTVVGNKFLIAAVTGADRTAAGGVVHLFSHDISDAVKKRTNPTVTLAVAFDSESARGVVPIPIVAATSNFSNSQNILIAYGSSPTLRFEDIQYNPNEKKQTIEREDPRIAVSRQEKAKENFKTIVPIINDSNTQYSSGALKSKLGRRPVPSLEKSLDDRLKALSVANDDDAKGHSLVETLKQALHSNDDRLIRSVLNYKDENVIRSTLKRLPPQYVPILIDHLTRLTHQKTANVQIAVRWFKLLLQIHASQLMALGKDELNDRFGSLLGILEKRTNTLVQLTGLSGRLDFLLNQIKRNADDDPIFNHENLLVYEDEASDEDHSDANDANSSDDVDMVNGDNGSTDDDDNDDEADDSMDDS